MTAIIHSKFKDLLNETHTTLSSLPLCGITIGSVSENSNWYFQELAVTALDELNLCVENFVIHSQMPVPEIERIIFKVTALHGFVRDKTKHKLDSVVNDLIIAADMAEHLWGTISRRNSGKIERHEDGSPNVELTLSEDGIKTETIYQFYKVASFISSLVKERASEIKRVRV